MVSGICIVGWRSDAGAYLVDSYPEGIEIDGQDLMNLFSLHRMAANGVMDKAGPDFNYLRLSEGFTLVSWYSGFRTTEYIAKPNFCVVLVLEAGENANAYEDQLRVICYNVLTRIEDNDFYEYMEGILDDVNGGYQIDPLEGYIGEGSVVEEDVFDDIGDPFEDEPVSTPPSNNIAPAASSPAPAQDDDFSELLALAEEQSSVNNGTTNGGTMANDPFSTSEDPFASNKGGSETFAGDPFENSASSSSSSFSSPPSPSMSANDSAPETAIIIQELKKLDRTVPKKPNSTDRNVQFKHMEKQVNYLEAKITILSKLIRGLQAKEIELKDKNELIAKLLALLS
jgi:hypothetical protein